MTRPNAKFRSGNSYGADGRDDFIHRSWICSEGLPGNAFDGRPVIGICNTWSELTPCNAPGPLAVVQSGDEILFDGPARKLDLLVSETEIGRRMAQWQAKRSPPKYRRGYYRLYVDHVLQAHRGCDLDFLVGASGADVERDSH